MIECSSKLTEEAWVTFNLAYFSHIAKSKRRVAAILWVVFLFLVLFYGSSLIEELNSYTDPTRSFVFPRIVILRILSDKIALLFIFLVFFIYESYRLYALHSTSYLTKRIRKLLHQEDFEGHRICLTDESVGSYSQRSDLRLSWSRITKVVFTEELIVLFGSATQCLVISMATLTKEETAAVKKKLEECFSGPVVML